MAEYDDYVGQLEDLKKLSQDGAEYWLARDLQAVLGYATWENFGAAILRGMESCENADVPIENHFRGTTKMVAVGSGAMRETEDWFLSRYACYLVAMNADSAKQEVAFAQTYFAIQTRLQEQQRALTDAERRAELRDRVKDANKGLNNAAQNAGVVKFGVFHDAGYKALYGGLGNAQIKEHKGIPAKDNLLDRIGHTELAANYFRITQTQQKLERDRVRTQHGAIETHTQVGHEVRKTMERISGTKPESLPAEPSIKKLKQAKAKRLAD
jgi:DNA-damage-inducible protein D